MARTGIEYIGNHYTLRFPNVLDEDTNLEVIKFHNINNTLQPLEAKIT